MKSVILKVQPNQILNGKVIIPGDKSISHRVLMLGSLAEGITTATGFLKSADTLSTLNIFKQLGVQIEIYNNDKLEIYGKGLHNLQPSNKILNCGNSGTCMRLMAGILAGQDFDSELVGDQSLLKRPMSRISEPLNKMGAKIETTELHTAPLKIEGRQRLYGIEHLLPIASAQVKSCLLLAGLFAEGETIITSPALTRDHTERLLTAFNYPLYQNNFRVCLQGKGKLIPTHIDIPGDISSAAFFIVGACISKNSNVVLMNVGINPSRLGVLHILAKMGASINIKNERLQGTELVGDIHVQSSKLSGINIPLEHVISAIDEFPILFIAAACASGTTALRNAMELRAKESDRIAVMAEGLQQLGIKVETLSDGIMIEGGQFEGGTVKSHGDHRVAMAFAIAGLVAKDEVSIDDCENINTSFPQFIEMGTQLGMKIKISVIPRSSRRTTLKS